MLNGNKIKKNNFISQKNRVHAIDGLRGFSLFGILIANLLIFQYGLFGKDYIEIFELNLLDQSVYAFTKIAFEASFMPIFTFLFGYSFMIMRDNLAKNELRIKWHLFRRSVILIGFGMLHATYLWEGDILFVYGLMGICLLVFVNRHPKTILIWTCLLFGLIGTINLPFFEEGDLFDSHTVETYINETTDVYENVTYAAIQDYRNNADDPVTDFLSKSNAGIAAIFMMPLLIAPMFLLGMYAAKEEWLQRPKETERTYKIGASICLLLGVLLKTYGYFSKIEGLFHIGGMVLSLGYICLSGVLYANIRHSVLLRSFESVGKLSLTNYIVQSIICTTIFYGYGLGLFSKLGMINAFLLGIVIFCIQTLMSHYYVKTFRYGPLEKLLRIGTYLSVNGKTKRQKQYIKDSKTS